MDIQKTRPVAFSPAAGEYWSLGERVGGYGFTKGKL